MIHLSPPHSPPAATHARFPILSISNAEEKMRKNSAKAITGHIQKCPESRGVLATIEEVFASKKDCGGTTPLALASAFQAKMGERRTMEDSSCIVSREEGTLAAIFDGHNGRRVSSLCQHQVADRFFSFLKDSGSPHAAFEATFDAMERDIERIDILNSVGSTAVVSFIDHACWKIYTATIGDSEATMYRKIGGTTKAIPLSPLENWAAAKALERYRRVKPLTYSLPANPKELRYPAVGCGVNVSRALGDRDYKIFHLDRASAEYGVTSHEGLSPLIHKCKITVQDLALGDHVVLACDGLKDFTTEEEVACILDSSGPDPDDKAENLVDFALKEKRSSDNVTVLVLSVIKPAST